MTGIILAVLQNTRMGVNKAFLEINGTRMIDKTIDIYSRLFSEILIITNDPLPYLNYPCGHRSRHLQSKGPLGGFTRSVLFKNPYVFVSACDMPYLNGDFIEYLAGLPAKP